MTASNHLKRLGAPPTRAGDDLDGNEEEGEDKKQEDKRKEEDNGGLGLADDEVDEESSASQTPGVLRYTTGENGRQDGGVASKLWGDWYPQPVGALVRNPT